MSQIWESVASTIWLSDCNFSVLASTQWFSMTKTVQKLWEIMNRRCIPLVLKCFINERFNIRNWKAKCFDKCILFMKLLELKYFCQILAISNLRVTNLLLSWGFSMLRFEDWKEWKCFYPQKTVTCAIFARKTLAVLNIFHCTWIKENKSGIWPLLSQTDVVTARPWKSKIQAKKITKANNIFCPKIANITVITHF